MIASLPTTSPPVVARPPGANNIAPGPNNVSISTVRPSDLPELAKYLGPDDLILFKPSVPQIIGAAGGAIAIAKVPLPKKPLSLPDSKPTSFPLPGFEPLLTPFFVPGASSYIITYRYFDVTGDPFAMVYPPYEFFTTKAVYGRIEIFTEGPIWGAGVEPAWKPYIEHEVGFQYTYFLVGKNKEIFSLGYARQSQWQTLYGLTITSITPVIVPDETDIEVDPPVQIPDTPPPLPRPKVPGQEGPDEIKPFKRPSPAPSPDPPPATTPRP
ncbi:hypothetical protein IQ247_18150, partial [Plectonema cf. radiosum LEGE 06105]|nr:hypothetical protein [Plectonema cf. radiosum LEGE 06105]